VTYQEVTDPVASARLGEVCGRAARVELFEGHARSGDIRAAALDGAMPGWAREAQAAHATQAAQTAHAAHAAGGSGPASGSGSGS
jgi:sulfopropanediol 3-dehydrogenase